MIKMNRKDTILIAVVINAGLLAILFTTAMIYDTEKALETGEFMTPLAENKSVPIEPQAPLVAVASTGDEVDNVLNYYSQPASQPILVETHNETNAPEPIAVQSNASDDDEISSDFTPNNSFVEVTVKKGDVLEKIARANGTTVGAIKEANHLDTEKLRIGQILKIPKKSSAIASAAVQAPPAENKKVDSSDAVYHVVKSGESPWKIAKQYNVKYEDILRLNNLDEDKARNLKIGDRIRVK